MRRLVLASTLATLALTACATGTNADSPPPVASKTAVSKPATAPGVADTYQQDEVVSAMSDFFGVTAEGAGAAVERIFRDQGRPVGYIAGEEISGAIGAGLRYGKGVLTLKGGGTRTVFWQGPSVGFDVGGNASRVFVLVYNLKDVDDIFHRFPGVEGSAYVVGGMGVNYMKGDQVTLAPIRAGVGLRLGASANYLAFSRKRQYLPF
jgi:hypothetical protein